MPDFTFSRRAGRFRGPSGRFLSSQQVRRIIDATLLSHTRAVLALTEQLRSRQLSLAEWERRMRVEVKGIHVYSSMLAKGGVNQLTQADLGRIGAAVKRQYRYLRRLGDELSSGTQRLDGTLLNRARLYGQSGRGTFEATRQREMRRRGFREERNVLAPTEHCEGAGSCVAESARGWVPLGSLIPIGGRLCVTNCRCQIEYRNSEGEIAA